MPEQIIEWLSVYRYAIILPISIIEGPGISMIGGFLLKLGVFSFWPLYIILMLGDLVGDVIWYYIGRRWGYGFVRRFGKYFSVTEESIETVKKIFHKYHSPILLASKITTGFGFSIVTLVTAGISHIPFSRFMLLNVLGQFIWTGMLIAVGYFFSQLYLNIAQGFEWFFIIAMLVLGLGMMYGFSRFMRRKIKQI